LFLPILKPPIDPTLDENQRANSSDEKAVLKILDCHEHPRIVTSHLNSTRLPIHGAPTIQTSRQTEEEDMSNERREYWQTKTNNDFTRMFEDHADIGTKEKPKVNRNQERTTDESPNGERSIKTLFSL
jgi:hypothetical protein